MQQIADYAESLSYDDLPSDVVDRTKHLIVDTLGCGIGGAQSLPARAAQAVAGEITSNKPASLFVTGHSTSPDIAAFANGVMLRYLDYNDTYLGGGHPSDMLAPVLACVQASGGDGKAAILGTVLAYEIYCGVRDGAEGGLRSRSLPPSGNQASFGPIAAAAVASKLWGLSSEQLGHAISLALVAHAPPLPGSGQLSHWKACRLANACRVGVFSAMLASMGLTGPERVFAGPQGFFEAIGTEFEFEAMKAGSFRIMRSHVKAFPCGFHGMGPATAALELHPRIARQLDRVREIRVHGTRVSVRLMAGDESRWKPETRETADHSIPFVVAMVLMEGALEVRHFDDAYFMRPEVRDFMSRIRVLAPESFEEEYHRVPRVRVEVEMDSGEELTAEVGLPLGHPQNPMPEALLQQKFRSLAEPVLPEPQIDELLTRLGRLEEEPDLGRVLALTVPSCSTRTAESRVKL